VGGGQKLVLCHPALPTGIFHHQITQIWYFGKGDGMEKFTLVYFEKWSISGIWGKFYEMQNFIIYFSQKKWNF
jgi:hypothetical protein